MVPPSQVTHLNPLELEVVQDEPYDPVTHEVKVWVDPPEMIHGPWHVYTQGYTLT